jgi:hypothetical protein
MARISTGIGDPVRTVKSKVESAKSEKGVAAGKWVRRENQHLIPSAARDLIDGHRSRPSRSLAALGMR